MVWLLCLLLPALLATVCNYLLLVKKRTSSDQFHFLKSFLFFLCSINGLSLLGLVIFARLDQSSFHFDASLFQAGGKTLLLTGGVGLALAGATTVFQDRKLRKAQPAFKAGITRLELTKTLSGWRLGWLAFGLLLFVAALLWTSSDWLLANFGLLNPSELIFHLKVPLAGTNTDYYVSYMKGPLLQALLITLGGFLLARLIFHFSQPLLKKRFVWNTEPFLKRIRWLRRSFLALAILLLGGSLTYNLYRLNFQDFVAYAFADSPLIAETYVSPKKVQLGFPEQKRNLIYIYMESLESSYFSQDLGGAEAYNLLPNLTELAAEGTHFSHNEQFGGAYQIAGTSWTVGGLVSQTTGLPLNIPIANNAYDEYDQFMPGAIALGDILKEEGYQQTFLIGSQAKFAGRDKYFSQHGDYEIQDYDYFVQNGVIPDGYTIGWGFEDQKLYPLAQAKLTELAANDQPFNLTLLTVDTHAPDGYFCELCTDDYPDQYANVIACADRQVVNFVRWVQQQDFYANTTIIIAGDHLSMDVDYFNKVIDPKYDRRTFNLILNAPITTEATTKRKFGEFDMFPTTLAALGVEIPGDRLGIGTNLYAATPTLFEEKGYKEAKKELEKNSNFYNNTFLYPNQK